MHTYAKALLTGTALVASAGPAVADSVTVGHIADYTGRTSVVGKVYGGAINHAMTYLNAKGGVAGSMMDFETYDYSYEVPRAIAKYQELVGQDAVAIQGWGTGDTEALSEFVAEDQIPYYSASYSAHLTDPEKTPYNFFASPSYSDAARALIIWAKNDWEARGMEGQPKYVHMGDNHPFPNAPKRAGEELAAELGFEVLPAIQFSLAPGDFKAQCLTLKESGAHYAHLANTAGSVISLLKSCATVGVETQFMGNMWAFDENAAKAAGTAGDGMVWSMGAAAWGADVPGMATVMEISKMADPDVDYRATHYMRGVCSAYYMAEAMAWAAENGGITGENIRQGMYQKSDWVPEGLDGICPPATWTAEDHRGVTDVFIYQASITEDPPADMSIGQMVNDGILTMNLLQQVTVERKPEWLGW